MRVSPRTPGGADETWLVLNTQWRGGARVSVPDILAQVRAARDAGFTSLWLPHHYLVAPMQMLQPMPLLGFLVPETEGMTLGMDILLLPLLNPVHVAEEWATLDVLSEGRAVLGVGLGYRPEEFDAFGVPIAERAARTAESIALIRRLWTEERVSFEGRFYRVNGAGLSIRPVQPNGRPIWLAAQVDAALRRAARLADGWLIVPSSTRERVAEQMAVYRAARQAAGRTGARAALTRECHIGSSRDTALAECREALEWKYSAYAAWGLEKAERARPDFESFARDKFLIGDTGSVRDEIARYRELGVDSLIVRPHWPGFSNEAAVRTIERLGKLQPEALQPLVELRETAYTRVRAGRVP